jgi:chromosomal replication initiation ATPase DnaA
MGHIAQTKELIKVTVYGANALWELGLRENARLLNKIDEFNAALEKEVAELAIVKSETDNTITLQELLAKLYTAYGTSELEMWPRTKPQELVDIRHCIAYLLMESKLQPTLSEVARILKMQHGSISYARDRVLDLVAMRDKKITGYLATGMGVLRDAGMIKE